MYRNHGTNARRWFLCFAQTGSAAGGSGPYAAPSAAAYTIIENAGYKIVADNKLQNQSVIVYDQQIFGMIPTYETAIEHLKKSMSSMCPHGTFRPALVSGLDIGGAASGLAALVTALTPSYAIQGQALTFDNSTLIAAFAKEAGSQVVVPAYLLPAAKSTRDLTCDQVESASSLAF